MGTTYHIILESNNPEQIKRGVDSLLVEINQAVSTYEKGSIITLFNQDYNAYLSNENATLNQYFNENYQISKKINQTTSGAFDPTIMPIVNYWGFGYTGKNKVQEVDTANILKLMSYVGFHKLTFSNEKVRKEDSQLEIDFSGVAKGYGVDKVATYLESLGISNFYVEIGGEVFTKGRNASNQVWRTGISLPSENASQDEFQQIVEISDKGIATSGNYRIYYESKGNIFSHTINPKTGFPERSNLLSATILAPSCAIADGYATACMVLGLEKSIELVNLQDEIEGIFVYSDENEEFQVYDSTKK
ncbi:FAD:protein FMN transferase [Portibacter lacus]|uniref:FAD:protein FMN transferase n=2 Tax=Portibacter lacus TaxID=1099794 RepID=A0AA37SXJ6_9BACT|nr:FAD:protein FMN transferase [Portibacter lacus]